MEMDEATKLAERRRLWFDCLNGDDPHSLVNQLYSLSWNAAAFRTVNEARRLSPPAKEGGIAQNALLHNLLDNCFWISQGTAVRRLVDSSSALEKSKSVGDNDKSVYSLGSLLEDMRTNIHLMTRANWFAAEELECDVRTMARREESFIMQRGANENRMTPIPFESDPWRAIELHARIDALAGVEPTSRTPHDKVRTEIICKLTTRMKSATDEIKKYVDKYFAHASTPQNRERAGASDWSITLNKLAEAQETLCGIHNFISSQFFDTEIESYIAFTYCDVLKYADRPLVNEASSGAVREFWKQQQGKGQHYSWTVEDLLCDPKS